ncbi:MAG: zinc-dependent metalloprotease [Planctomycetes bacterium]|nr:zinc-dependent metalloprotease [Planctomycetota bacterium]
MKKIFFLLLSIAALFAYLGCNSTDAGTENPAQKEESKDKEKPFAEVIKDYTPITGCFNIYYKADEGKAFLEIKPEQFDNIYLCSIVRESGDGGFFDSASMEDSFPFIFRKVNKTIQFIHKNVYYTADKSSPFYKAIERGVSDSLMGSAKIESAPHPETKGILIDLGNLFLQDFPLVSFILSEYAKQDYSFDRENSYFASLKSFSRNTEISVIMTFRSGRPKWENSALPDARGMTLRYHYSLSALPETGYTPRLADDRIGHFITMFQDYTTVLKDTPYIRYVERWRLEKAAPDAELSSPKQPIVFWMEKTIPTEFREAVKKGILLWNNAFEKIGIKDAIEVRQQPDDADWDPADIRYNTICWILKPRNGYAVGPSQANPLTGEIYAADIRISADIVRSTFLQMEELIEPVQNKSKHNRHHQCDYGNGLNFQAAFGLALLNSRGSVSPDDPEIKKFINDYITDLVVHEVGHTLGLRHNFKASSIRKIKELHDACITEKYGYSGSVMDYMPINIAPKGINQGAYWQTELGYYDYWAIEYAYKPLDAKTLDEEKKELDKIASRLGENDLSYGTDEDSFGFSPEGVDPLCNQWDLSDDPITFFRLRIELVKELWKNIAEGKFAEPGMRYTKMRNAFAAGFGAYSVAGLCASKFIGGLYFRRDHAGDPDNRLPFEPVSAEEQRAAIAFLREYIFAPDAFSFPAELLNKLSPERFPQFEHSNQKIDFPIHASVLNVQKPVLERIYHPMVLQRIIDTQLKYKENQDVFTLAELFARMRDAIWSELLVKSNLPAEASAQAGINSFRRALQKEHLEKLIQLAVKPPESIPSDATALARADLVALDSEMAKLLNDTIDITTKAHLEECRALIAGALKAGYQR